MGGRNYMEQPFIIGIPKGNLNREENYKGNTQLLLKLAGLDLPEYKSGSSEAIFRLKYRGRDLEFQVNKPSELLRRVQLGEIQLALIGKDTVEERFARYFSDPHFINNPFIRDRMSEYFNKVGLSFEGFLNWSIKKLVGIKKDYLAKRRIKSGILEQSREELWQNLHNFLTTDLPRYEIVNHVSFLGDLGYGKVDLCFQTNESNFQKYFASCDIANRDFSKAESIKCATPYPHIAFRELCRTIDNIALREYPDYQREEDIYKIMFNRCPLRINELDPEKVVVSRVPNNTEASIDRGSNLILDCVASGNNMRRYGLRQLGPVILTSTVALYGPDLYHNMVRNESQIPSHFINIQDYLVKDLIAASLEYGRTRKDSIYFKE